MGFLNLQADLYDPVEELCNLLKVSLLEASGGHGWRADTCTSRCHCTHISHHSVLVQRDVAEVACLLQFVARQALQTTITNQEPRSITPSNLAMYSGDDTLISRSVFTSTLPGQPSPNTGIEECCQTTCSQLQVAVTQACGLRMGASQAFTV